MTAQRLASRGVFEDAAETRGMTSIQAIAGALPEKVVTNEELHRENPAWQMGRVEEITGIRARHIAAEDETPFDLSVRACDELLARPDVDADGIDAILYCTQAPDYPWPGNGHLLHEHLGLGDKVLTLDFMTACSGFVYGVAIADSLVRGDMASKILLVTAETPSKGINPGDRSARVLFGDGAAATYLAAASESGGRIVASELCTHGRGFKHAYMPTGGLRAPLDPKATGETTTDQSGNVRGGGDVHMYGTELWSFVSTAVPKHVEAFLTRNSLTVDDIDLVVFHQASKVILRTLAKSLQIPPEKVFAHMQDIGNLSSSSIPFALRAALETKAIRPGSRVLLCGFGSGISYGSVIVEF